MNKRQLNKWRMFGSVVTVLDENSALVSSLNDLAKAKERFNTGLVTINQNRQVQEAKTAGLTKDKTELRNDLIPVILQVSSALKAYAVTVSNNELMVKCDYAESDLIRSSDPILADIGNLILGLATPLKEELSKFFVSETELNKLDRLLTAFKSAIPKRRVASSTSKVSTVNIREVFNAQDLLLKEQIDVLMQPFRFTQPDFYNAYRNARLIVDYAGRGAAKTEATTPV